jgi:hypothetical protein
MPRSSSSLTAALAVGNVVSSRCRTCSTLKCGIIGSSSNRRYGLYLQKGKPAFVYNLLNLKRTRFEGGVGAEDWLGRSLSPGKHTIVFDFKLDGPGLGKGGTGTLSVDGRVLSRPALRRSGWS